MRTILYFSLYSFLFLITAQGSYASGDSGGKEFPFLAKRPFNLPRPLYPFHGYSETLNASPVTVNLFDPNEKKSAGLAAAFSFILPGTGELYAQNGRESVIKGASLLALEAATWILYFKFHSDGKSKERKYEKYADQNWDVDKYLSFLETSLSLSQGDLGRQGTNNIDYNGLINAEDQWGTISQVAVHHLYANGQQQYYEEIYKYPAQFALGWSDAVDPMQYPQTGYTHNDLTPVMLNYRGMRNDSNRLLGHARAMTGIMLINRVLSVADAVWTVKRKNKNSQVGMGVRIEPQYFKERLLMLPTLRITY